jgi:hypothetical protein
MAATGIDILTIGITASATIAQYQAVQATGAAATAAGNAIGFARIGGASGDRIPVTVLGTSLAVAGAAITAGALVEIGSTVTQVVTKSAGVAVGRALTAATQAGDIIEVYILPN